MCLGLEPGAAGWKAQMNPPHLLFISFFFFLNGPILASFSVYFRLFNTLQFKFFKLEKSVDGVLGIRTRGGRMEGANESTELQRHPDCYLFLNRVSFLIAKFYEIGLGTIIILQSRASWMQISYYACMNHPMCSMVWRLWQRKYV